MRYIVILQIGINNDGFKLWLTVDNCKADLERQHKVKMYTGQFKPLNKQNNFFCTGYSLLIYKIKVAFLGVKKQLFKAHYFLFFQKRIFKSYSI